jgi:hypothetical protein
MTLNERLQKIVEIDKNLSAGRRLSVISLKGWRKLKEQRREVVSGLAPQKGTA